MTKKVKTEEVAQVRVILLETNEGDKRITLPAGSRITFGPTIPYQKKDSYGQEHKGYSLRVYSSSATDSLIAVFCGISSFRDITIPVEKLIIREAGKSVWKSDEHGYKVENEVQKEGKWVDSLHQLESK